MIRTLGGIAAGLATAIVLMMVMEGVGNQIAPIGVYIDTGSPEPPTTSLLSLIFPVLGWFLGALIGGWVAILIAGRFWTAWAIAAVVFLATVATFLLMPFPAWMIIAGAIAPLAGGFLAKKLAAIRTRRRERLSE